MTSYRLVFEIHKIRRVSVAIFWGIKNIKFYQLTNIMENKLIKYQYRCKNKCKKVKVISVEGMTFYVIHFFLFSILFYFQIVIAIIKKK